MADPTAGTMTLSEFARYKGWRPSYVTELKLAGRLVMTDDGRHVRVADTLARLAATSDPSKAGVADRHAAGRASRADAAAGHGDGDDDHDDDHGHHAASAAPAAAAAGGSKYQNARAAREQYLAAQAKLDYEERIGKLVDAASVRAAGADMGTTVRRRLEALPTLISAQVDERDRDRVFTLITDHVEQTLSDMERAFTRATTRKESA